MKYRIVWRDMTDGKGFIEGSGRFVVERRFLDDDWTEGEELGSFLARPMAELFVRALLLADFDAPIAEGLDL